MGRRSSYASLGNIPGSGNKKILGTLLTGFVIGIIVTFLLLQNTPYYIDLETNPMCLKRRLPHLNTTIQSEMAAHNKLHNVYIKQPAISDWIHLLRCSLRHSTLLTELFEMRFDSVSNFGDPYSHADFDSGPTIEGEIGQHSSHEEFHKDEDVVAREIARRVRVLCWVLTSPVNHETKAKHVKATWGKHCNTLIFMSSANDTSLGAVALHVKEDHSLLWGKTKRAFSHVYQHYTDEYDWVLKADDDTYVVVENLRYMLYHYNTSEPMYFGCRFKPYVKQGFMSGGAGYVLSKEAVHRFVTQALPDPQKCSSGDSGAEDVEIGKCLENVGVAAMDSRDQYLRGRFFPFTPDGHMFAHYDANYWYWKYVYYNTTDGMNCCSDLAITFHYVPVQEMYVMEYLIYHLRPFGIQHQDFLNITKDQSVTS